MNRTGFSAITAIALVLAAGGLHAIPPQGSVVINEVVIDSRGSNLSDQEFIELWAPPGTSLAGLSVITVVAIPVPEQQYEAGTVVRRFDLPSEARTGTSGMYLLANQYAESGYSLKADMPFGADRRLTNEPQTIALLPTELAPEPGQTVSGVLRDSDVFDAVALRDYENRDNSRFFFGAPIIGPDQTFLAAGAVRVRDGVDTDDMSDWVLADIANPPTTYNTPGAPNKQGAQAVVSDASNVTPAPSSTPPEAPVQVHHAAAVSQASAPKWRYYNPVGVEQAVEEEGSALVYVRSARFVGCKRFEQLYLLHKDAAPLLAGRPTFYLDVNQPGHGRFASMLGVYRVPTMVFRKKGMEPRYLAITESTPPAEIVAFLRMR